MIIVYSHLRSLNFRHDANSKRRPSSPHLLWMASRHWSDGNRLNRTPVLSTLVKHRFARFEGGDFEGKPRPGHPTQWKAQSFTTLLKRIRRLEHLVLRRDWVCALNSPQSPASRLSVTRKCWLDGSLMSLPIACVSPGYPFVSPLLHRNEFLEDLVAGHAVWLLWGENPPAKAQMGLHPKKSLVCWSRRNLVFRVVPARTHIQQHKKVGPTLMFQNLAVWRLFQRCFFSVLVGTLNVFAFHWIWLSSSFLTKMHFFLSTPGLQPTATASGSSIVRTSDYLLPKRHKTSAFLSRFV